MALVAGHVRQARAYVDHVRMSLHGELPRLPDVRAVSELEDALSVMDQAGYPVAGRTPSRGSLQMVEAELSAASDDLREVEHRFDRDRLARAGGRVETALEYLRWRVKTPESPVLERVVAVAGAAAGSARPLADAIMRVGDDLPSGPVDLEAERRRAVETTFASAVRWLPLAAAAAGDAEVGESLRDLQQSQASYLAEFLREQAPDFPNACGDAVEDAALALEAAASLAREPILEESVAVAEQAAQVLAVMVKLRSPSAVEELRWLVEAAGGWPLRLPPRDLS